MSETNASPSLVEKLKRLLPLIVFVIALLVRIWGIGWGLPNENRHWSYHPDEPPIYVYSRQIEPAKFDFEPGFYNYGTFYLTLLRIAGDVAVKYSGQTEEPWMEMGAAHVAGRWINAFAGAGTALVVFLMLRRRVGEIGAVFGSLLVAFAPGFVIHSRFQTVDVFATFLLALSAHFALRLLPDSDSDPPILDGRAFLKTVIWSGVFAGLSAATKYTGILGLITLFAAIYFSKSLDKPKLAIVGLVTSIVAFLLAVPGVFLNWPKFWADFTYEMQHTSEGHGVVFAGLPSGFVWHVYNLIVGVGPILVAMGLIGLLIAIFKKDRGAIAVGALFLFYYLLIGRAEVMFLRYTFPLLIGLAYGFGWLVYWSRERKGWSMAIPVLGMVGLGGLFGGGLASAATSGLWMAGKDPRDEAVDYIRSKSTATTTVGLVADPWYSTPPFYFDTGAPRYIPFQLRHQAMLQAEGPKLLRFVPSHEDERYDWDTRLLDLKPDYVIFSSSNTEGVDRLRYQNDMSDIERLLRDRFVAFTELLVKEYSLDAKFGGIVGPGGEQKVTGIHDMDYVRPLIWIWKRKEL